MELEHEFTVPVPVEQAWPVLLDVERVAPCMPGATLDAIDGDEITGRLKVKVGPVTMTYRGTVGFVDTDEQARTVTVEGSGKETRGAGTASATMRAALHAAGDSTRVTVHTDLRVTGKPAQFGRNVLSEVGAKLIDRFAECLAGQLSDTSQDSAPATSAASRAEQAAPAAPTTPAPEPEHREPIVAAPSRPAPGSGPAAAPPPGNDALNLLDIAGAPVLKRALPAVGGLLALLSLMFVVRRKRRRRPKAHR